MSKQSPKCQWYRGNLHTHTTNSDGDSAPEDVARWYQQHGYDFLALTDHDYVNHSVTTWQEQGETQFLLITGEELTSDQDGHPIHLNAFGLVETIPPAYGMTPSETIQRNVELIRKQGALASLNHPYWGRGVSPDDLSSVRGLKLIEVFNGNHQDDSPNSDPTSPAEYLWDKALSLGCELYAIASDDAHRFQRFGPTLANPGRGWVQVRATDLDQGTVLTALEAGEFYASTGVELEEVERDCGRLRLKIRQQSRQAYVTRFIGQEGRLLSRSDRNDAEYVLQPGDAYVRATVVDREGRKAWVQPVWAT